VGRASFQELEVEVQIVVHSSGVGWLRMRVGELESGKLGVGSILCRKWTMCVRNLDFLRRLAYICMCWP
jgi:hypothetical protein